MLVLTRKAQQQIQIGDNITVTVLRVKGNSIRIGIEAPGDVRVVRGELQARDEAAAVGSQQSQRVAPRHTGSRLQSRVVKASERARSEAFPSSTFPGEPRSDHRGSDALGGGRPETGQRESLRSQGGNPEPNRDEAFNPADHRMEMRRPLGMQVISHRMTLPLASLGSQRVR